jgi:hypothetical protein
MAVISSDSVHYRADHPREPVIPPLEKQQETARASHIQLHEMKMPAGWFRSIRRPISFARFDARRQILKQHLGAAAAQAVGPLAFGLPAVALQRATPGMTW